MILRGMIRPVPTKIADRLVFSLCSRTKGGSPTHTGLPREHENYRVIELPAKIGTLAGYFPRLSTIFPGQNL